MRCALGTGAAMLVFLVPAWAAGAKATAESESLTRFNETIVRAPSIWLSRNSPFPVARRSMTTSSYREEARRNASSTGWA